MATELSIVLALILLNGIFAGAEFAVIALRKSRLEQLRKQGSRRARLVLRLRDAPERFLATVQIGITVVGATAAAFGGAALAEHVAPFLAATGWMSAEGAWQVSLALVIALVSFLSLVLGELVPKSLALKFGETYALTVAGPLVFLSSIARPIVWLLTASSNLVLRPFGDRTNFTEARLSPEELRHIVREASRVGTLGARAGEIATRALDFEDLMARDVMIPRDLIAAIPRDAPPDRLPAMVLAARHSRLPVFDRDLDHVLGYVAAGEVLATALEGREADLGALLRPIPFVPDVRPVTAVLQQLQRERRRIAMVVDEFGGVAGVVTMEDLLEELVGEVMDEHEVPAMPVRRAEDGSAFVRGDTPAHDLERELGTTLPDGHYSTVAGLVLEMAGRIPAAGESFTLPDGSALEIVEATPRRIRMVRVRPPATEPAPPPA